MSFLPSENRARPSGCPFDHMPRRPPINAAAPKAPGGPGAIIVLGSAPALRLLSPAMEQAKLFGVRLVPIGKESVMRNRVLSSAALLTLLALPLAACQTGAATGAAGGAVTGAVVGGPVGAVVGGVAGAAVGSALSAEESTRVRTFTVAQRRPSIRMTEEVMVGQPLPPRVRLYPVPRTVGLQSEYSYTVVNDQTVLVDPQTREVVQVIE